MAGRRWSSKGHDADSGCVAGGVIILSSDDEANEDLSLQIAEKAKQREAKQKQKQKQKRPRSGSDTPSEAAGTPTPTPTPVVVDLCSDEAEETATKKKKRVKKKKKKSEEIEPALADAPAPVVEEGPSSGTADSEITEANGAEDNTVLRKLLRGPRYFDPGEQMLATCYNCGEEGHVAARCTMERRQKPCFVCGLFGHNFKQCTQGQDCFICKRRGHIAKDCPDKGKQASGDMKICLQCGNVGHDMLSCKNSYAAADLKAIQCYVCKKYGHLCCAEFEFSGPTEVSCYNCAQVGHSGLGCAKKRGETSISASPSKCYKCGEEGHFARGCTKNTKGSRRKDELSTPNRGLPKKNRNYLGSKSAPYNGGARKRKNIHEHDEERGTRSSSKSKAVSWSTPRKPVGNNRIARRHDSWAPPSMSHSPRQFGFTGTFDHGYYTPRQGPQGRRWRD